MKKYKYIKYIVDKIFAISMIIFLSPLFLSIFVFILINDPGPIFFKQKRVGMNGKLFILYKFRTMPIDTKEIASDKIETLNLKLVSRILRRTNLDELPQLFNLLIGEMSLVGPRPALPSQFDLNELREKTNVIKLKPGMTGFAQVNSYTGMTFNEKVKFDIIYRDNISFLFDIKIIVKTFFYFLKSPPSY